MIHTTFVVEESSDHRGFPCYHAVKVTTFERKTLGIFRFFSDAEDRCKILSAMLAERIAETV